MSVWCDAATYDDYSMYVGAVAEDDWCPSGSLPDGHSTSDEEHVPSVFEMEFNYVPRVRRDFMCAISILGSAARIVPFPYVIA